MAAPARHLMAVVPRKARVLPVRFGVERALSRGITVNLSVDGMFIGVGQPEDGGRSLLLHLDLDGHTIPMRGVVMWHRPRTAAHRPAGMGIRLSNPPPVYQSYVSALP
jgi:Tfp pilus assembly protein PilZ